MRFTKQRFKMKTIWKYNLGGGANIFDIPRGYEVLSVIEQHGGIVLYCLVDPIEEKVATQFTLVGTGQGLDNSVLDMNFIGTVAVQDGYTVWHVFEKLK